MWLLFAFIAVPLIEIALFIQVGGAIGLWPTLGIVLGTALLGTFLVRSQGSRALTQLGSSIRELQDPTEPLAHGAMILFSAALLLTPGFFTDAVGFALLIPQVRSAVLAYAKKHVKVRNFEMNAASGTARYSTRPAEDSQRGPVIEGEFEEANEPGPKPGEDGAFGWTRR